MKPPTRRTDRSSRKLLAIILTMVSCFLARPALAGFDNCDNSHSIRGFEVDGFLMALESGAFSSVETALCLIPEAIRRNAVLVNNSISLQDGSFENPRVIMFDIGSNDTPVKYAISYNGHPSQRQFNSFEIMKFDMSKSPREQIEFIDVHFEGSGTSPKIRRNPNSCFACHRFGTEIPRPLWDATGFQPSVYGGGQSSSFMKNIGQIEARRAQSFIDSYATHPRYKNLGPMDIEVVSDPKKSNLVVPETDLAKPFVLIKSAILGHRNNLFGHRLAIINRRRVAEIIRTSKDFDKYKYAVAAALSDCHLIADFVPETARRNHENFYSIDESLVPPLSDSNVLRAQQNKSEMFFDPREQKLNLEGFKKVLSFRGAHLSDEVLAYFIDTEASALQWGGADAERTANLRWLFETRAISMAAWNMDATGFSQGSYRFINYSGHNASREDLTLYFQELIKVDRELRMFFQSLGIGAYSSAETFIQSMSSTNKEKLCGTLKNKSLNAFN